MHLKSVDYSKYITVVDMGLLWRLSTPSPADKGKGDRIVCTLKNYGDKVFGTILFLKHIHLFVISGDFSFQNQMNYFSINQPVTQFLGCIVHLFTQNI